MEKILYISSATPDFLLDSIRKHQINNKSNSLQSISKFHNNLIRGIANQKVDITSLNVPPISRECYDYKYFKGLKRNINNISYKTISFVNYKVIKLLNIFFKFTFHTLKWIIENRNENKVIIYDGSFRTIYLMIVVIKKIFPNIKITCIILDVYDYMGLEGFEKSSNLFKKAISSTDNFILITEKTNNLINKKNKPYLILEGIADTNDGLIKKTDIQNKIVYAGGIHEEYGVLNLARAFREVDTDAELHFYGNGDSIEEIIKLSNIDNRIKYMGSVPNSQLVKIESESLFLVNPRITGKEYTKYSFPSKLIEYLASGRPVLTTKLEGIPSEYDEYFCYFSGNETNDLVQDLRKMLNYDFDTLNNIGEKGRNFVLKNKNKNAIGKKVYNFVFDKKD